LLKSAWLRFILSHLFAARHGEEDGHEPLRWYVLGVACGQALCTAHAQAETHALIMTISAYQGGVPQLQGVKHDGESARQIARKMGVGTGT